MNLLGNLDCEAAWAGVALPQAVRRRISLYATLFAACAPAEEHHAIWVPAAIDPARLLAAPGWTPPVVHVLHGGAAAAPRFDLAWADPGARLTNDRAATLAIAQSLGVALPGAQIVASLDELDAAAAALAGQPWICKARWTAAGRDRARGTGAPTGELRSRIARLFARFGALVFEPWLDRVGDFGVCGEVTGAGVEVHPPHRLHSDARGGFTGIELAAVDPAIAEPLRATAAAAAQLTADRTGYRGPFAVDAFVYRDGAGERLHPLCELNARHTFGWIARALAHRLGIHRLGFTAPPADATVLIAPGDDGATAWCA